MRADAGSLLPLRKKYVYSGTLLSYHNYKCMNPNLIIAGSSLIVRNTGQQFIFDEEKIWTPSVFMVNVMLKRDFKKLSDCNIC